MQESKKWIHNSRSTNKDFPLRSVKQDDDQCLFITKPKGLWCSPQVDNISEWQVWCEKEGFGMYKSRYEVKLLPEAKILMYGRAEHKQYGTDWKKIADTYDGMIIPFDKTKNKYDVTDSFTRFLYSLDVNSLVIWNKDAVEIQYLGQYVESIEE